MTEARIPEEILREILEEVLWPRPISHWLDESADVRDAELGGPTFKRSTRVLTVCKRWMRVATPIFYRYVRLSKPAQVEVLAEVLRKNPDIGRAVSSARGWVRSAPGYRAEETAGLVRGLSLIQPTRLYMHNVCPCGRTQPTKNPRTVRQTIMERVKQWSKLEWIYVARSEAFIADQSARDDLAQATKGSTVLKIVSIPLTISWSLTSVPWLSELPCLEAIHCRMEERLFNSMLQGANLEMQIPENMRAFLVHKVTRDVVPYAIRAARGNLSSDTNSSDSSSDSDSTSDTASSSSDSDSTSDTDSSGSDSAIHTDVDGYRSDSSE